MDTGFVDLDILLTRIRHPQSKVYFLDAVKAYKAGALRGALTSAWVALVYDLIAKDCRLSFIFGGAADDGSAGKDERRFRQRSRNTIIFSGFLEPLQLSKASV